MTDTVDTICGWPRVRIPESCGGVDIVIGVDEAGRGPVLGSLVYCAAFWPLSEHDEICKLGFDDSKQLKEGERDDFFNRIRTHPSIGWVIEELTAVHISEEMLKPQPISLNALSYDAVIRALETIRDANPAPNVTDIFIDTVGDPETYKLRLTRALGQDFGRFTIEKKADATYKVVGAASIIAKVTRDTILKEWKWPEKGLDFDKNFGSGYPSDEVCVNWLASVQDSVFGYPSLIRHSWSTCREALIKGGACDIKWECDEDDTGGSGDIKTFFAAVGDKRPKRAAHFIQRKMKHVLPDDLWG